MKRHYDTEGLLWLGVCIFALVLNLMLLVAVAMPSAAEDTPQKKCEKEYTKYLQSYIDHTETPAVPDCKNMTDSQWYAINARTDKLHNEIFASK